MEHFKMWVYPTVILDILSSEQAEYNGEYFELFLKYQHENIGLKH